MGIKRFFAAAMALATSLGGFQKISEFEWKKLNTDCRLRKKNYGGRQGGKGPMAMPRRWAKGKIHSYKSMLTEKMIATRNHKTA